MTIYLGDFPTGKTIYVPFHTFNSSGASVTITGLAVTDIEIYRNGSATQRASDAGYTLLDTDGIDFDGLTGIHGFSIDTSDNTEAGFNAAGDDYWGVISAITVDSQTVNFVAATFSIDNRQLLRPTVSGRTLDVSAGGEAGIDWANVGSPTTTVSLSGTTVATVTTTTTATNLTNAPTNGDLTATMKASVNAEVDAAIETYHLDHLLATTYDPASKPGAADALLNELVESDAGVARFTANALEQAPTGGGDGGLLASGTAAGIANGTITLASGHGITNTTVLIVLTGGTNAVGKSRAATYSGTGDVFNVDPDWNATVNGVTETTPSGTITYDIYPLPVAGSAFPPAVSVSELQASALADLFNTDSGTTYASAVAGSVVKEIADNAGGSSLTVGDIADAVWDEARSGHVAAGSFGEGVASVQGNVTGSVGSVAAGGITAASIATGAIDADAIASDAVTEIQSGLATAANLATVDTVVDGIKAKTDSLTFTVTGKVDANVTHVIADPITSSSSKETNWGGTP